MVGQTIQEKEKQVRRCCICGIELHENEGHNPYPICSEGEACDYCDYEVVIPAQAKKFFKEENWDR